MQMALWVVITIGVLLGIWPGTARAAETVILACRVPPPGIPGSSEVSSCGTSAGVPVACPVSPPFPPPPGLGASCAQTLANFLTPSGFKLADVHAIFDQIVYTIVNKRPVDD